MPSEISEPQSRATEIDGLLVFDLKQVSDERGTVREFYRASGELSGSGLGPWRQINVTQSRHGAVRGLHGEAMTKLVACVAGSAFGVYLDARPASASYGALVTVDLTAGVQVLVPDGVCNGFQTVSKDDSQYLYCFTEEWRPGMPGAAFSPLDPGLDLRWPIPVDPSDPSRISAKDATAPRFSEQLRSR